MESAENKGSKEKREMVQKEEGQEVEPKEKWEGLKEEEKRWKNKDIINQLVISNFMYTYS